LADTWDALGGAVPRERALIIMKDSRLGSYGAIALVLALVCKALALHALALASLTAALWALVLLHAVSRAATVCVIAALPYAGDEAHAKAKPLARQVGREAVAVALGTCAAAAAVAWVAGTDARALLALAAAATVAAWMSASWLRRRLGGYTGDGLGAIQQHVELAGLLTAAVLPAGWLTA
jgi:adenosylcobinamide-GDP ribazoletransferase